MLEREGTDVGEDKAFSRHVRQYVQAPDHRFAAIVPPELAPVCKSELTLLGFSDATITSAGVEYSDRLKSCYLPNLCLRTASRVLCRFKPFRAGAPEELFQKVSNIRWELWINHRIPMEMKAFVQGARIRHEGLVVRAVSDGVSRRFQSRQILASFCASSGEDDGPVSGVKQRILVHLRNNQCVISLDTTGEHLHRRGYRLEHTGAPLRETLAAAILLRSKWHGDIPLVDGMCGAGTVAIEAALLARRMPPGLRRSFLFQSWPGFEEKSWNYLCKTLNSQILPHPPVPILAIDGDPETIRVARENAQRAGVHQDIQWHCMDLFTLQPLLERLRPGLLILDPPYGRRTEGGGKDLYERLGHHLRRSFEGWQMAILAPDKAAALSLKIPRMRLWQINHGGLPVYVAMGRV